MEDLDEPLGLDHAGFLSVFVQEAPIDLTPVVGESISQLILNTLLSIAELTLRPSLYRVGPIRVEPLWTDLTRCDLLRGVVRLVAVVAQLLS